MSVIHSAYYQESGTVGARYVPHMDVLKKMCEYLVMLVTKVTSEIIDSGM